MALLKSIATGNFTDSTTWATAINVAENSPSVTSTVQISTTNVSSEAFVITSTADLTGILLKITSRSSSAGTATFELFDSTASVIRASVTVNLSDLPDLFSTSYHWMFIKFNTALTSANYVSGNNHQIRARTSITNGLTLGTGGTSTTWSRAIITNTNATPIAGDTFVVVGDITSTGTNSYTVTMNNTASTKFGIPGRSINTYGLWVGHNATLTYGTEENTNYLLVINDNIGIGIGGTVNIGTVASPVPRSSTAVLEIDCTTTSLSQGIYIIAGTLIVQGQSRTAGNNSDRCLLTVDAASGSTNLNIDTDTGWLLGDEIGISRTERAGGFAPETRSLASNATSNSLSLTSGLSASKLGDPLYVQAMVVLLTRNAQIRSANFAYEYTFSTNGNGRTTVATVDADWMTFKYCGRINMGSNTTFSLNFNYCILDRRNSTNIACGIFQQGQGTNGFTITNFICYRSFFVYQTRGVAGQSFSSDSIANNIWIICAPFGYVTDPCFNVDGLRIQGQEVQDGNSPLLNLGNYANNSVARPTSSIIYNNIHISCPYGQSFQVSPRLDEFNKLIINNLTIVRGRDAAQFGPQGGLYLTCDNVEINNFKIFDNGANVLIYEAYNTKLKNGSIAAMAGSGFSTNGVRPGPYTGYYNAQTCSVIFDNVIFGAGFEKAAPNSRDLSLESYGLSVNNHSGGELFFRNCFFSNQNIIGETTYSSINDDTSIIYSDKHNLAPGNKKIWNKWGEVSTENTITYPRCIDPKIDRLRDGLVGYWLPSAGATGLDLFDLSSYGLKGTLTNMDIATDWVQTSNGLALDFDGVDDYVIVSRNGLFDTTKGCAISIWINFLSAADGDYFSLSGFNAIRLQKFSGSILIRRGGGNVIASGTIAPSLNVLNHIVYYYNPGSNLNSVWLNGQDITNNVAPPNCLSVDRIYFGATSTDSSLPGLYGQCQIANVAVYNRPLIPLEVMSLYNLGPNKSFKQNFGIKEKALSSTYSSLRIKYRHPSTVPFQTSAYPVRNFQYAFLKCVIAKGTSPFVSLKIRKSTALDGQVYNGDQPKIIVKENPIVGLSSDTVIATATSASNGDWEILTGYFPQVTNSGVVEVVLECNGTTGWVNIKDLIAPTNNTLGFNFTDETLDFSTVGNNIFDSSNVRLINGGLVR